MGGHAYEEVMEAVTISDVVGLATLILLLMIAGYHIAQWLKRKCQDRIRKEIEKVRRENNIPTISGQQIKV